MFGASVRTINESHASCLASREGSDAFAIAANSPPLAVLSAARASSMSAALTTPAAASDTSSCHDRSVSISRPSRVVDPSRRAFTVSAWAGVDAADANAVTNCSWLSLPASACWARAHSPSATRSRAASRVEGATT